MPGKFTPNSSPGEGYILIYGIYKKNGLRKTSIGSTFHTTYKKLKTVAVDIMAKFKSDYLRKSQNKKLDFEGETLSVAAFSFKTKIR